MGYFAGGDLLPAVSVQLLDLDLVSGLMCSRLAFCSFESEQHLLVTTPISFFYLLFIIEGINN